MKQKWKRACKAIFAAPEPQRKREFLKKIDSAGMTTGQFLWTQASYIRKWIWVVSAAVFLVVLWYWHFENWNSVWVVSSLMPFLAVTSVTEIGRSEVYGMAELEMASRFSFKSIVLARMGILCVLHSLILFLAALLFVQEGGGSLFRTGVYLLVPYLLTDVAGLWISRKMHGKEAVYAIFGMAVIIAALPGIGRTWRNLFYEKEVFVFWAAALAVLCAAFLMEWKKKIERTEELVWNL